MERARREQLRLAAVAARVAAAGVDAPPRHPAPSAGDRPAVAPPAGAYW